MDIVTETVEQGVVERRFDLKVEAEVVPGILWLPEGASGPRPTVLIGHGGTQHKPCVAASKHDGPAVVAAAR